jgi:ectoine hydroxylase-related dioxygenase (phytanoyl-CoA dioxygenase family)
MTNPSETNLDPAVFSQHGYCLFRDVLGAEEIEAARNELDSCIRNMPARMVVYKDGDNKEVDGRPEYLTEPHVKNDFWLQLCRHPKILDAVESVLGKDLILIMSHLIVKPPHDGLPVAWHQDNTYWHSVAGTDIATVWLAIDDADLSNGCMQVIPRSHEGYPEMEKFSTGANDLLGLTVEVTSEMESALVSLEMQAGGLSIHDSYIVHGSNANTSTRRRAAYTMRYANARTVTIDTAQHWVPVYLVRGEGGTAATSYVDSRER